MATRLLARHGEAGVLTDAAVDREAQLHGVAPSTVWLRYDEYCGRLARTEHLSATDIETIAPCVDLLEAARRLTLNGRSIPLAVLERLVRTVPGRALGGLTRRHESRRAAMTAVQALGTTVRGVAS